MALLPQGPVAPGGLRVRELVAQGRFPHQSLLRQWSREDAAAVDRAMAATATARFADRPVDALSGGQRQRVWIAMVLAQETGVLLLDEPTTFLDLKVQVDLMGLLRRVAHGEGRTLVVVMHELNVAAAFAAAGLVAQAGRSGKYDLGPGALRLGLAALARHDFVNSAADKLPDLRDETQMTVLLSVWGNGGATVVRWERAASPVVTSMGLGTVLPLLTSATGRAFLAYAPSKPLGAVLSTETARLRSNRALSLDVEPDDSGIAALRAQVRTAGYASVDGRFIPGLVAAASPILNWQGEATAVVTLIGTDPASVSPGARTVAALKRFCAERSLGGDGA